MAAPGEAWPPKPPKTRLVSIRRWARARASAAPVRRRPHRCNAQLRPCVTLGRHLRAAPLSDAQAQSRRRPQTVRLATLASRARAQLAPAQVGLKSLCGCKQERKRPFLGVSERLKTRDRGIAREWCEVGVGQTLARGQTDDAQTVAATPTPTATETRSSAAIGPMIVAHCCDFCLATSAF